jgi:hypothetical protein
MERGSRRQVGGNLAPQSSASLTVLDTVHAGTRVHGVSGQALVAGSGGKLIGELGTCRGGKMKQRRNRGQALRRAEQNSSGYANSGKLHVGLHSH